MKSGSQYFSDDLPVVEWLADLNHDQEVEAGEDQGGRHDADEPGAFRNGRLDQPEVEDRSDLVGDQNEVSDEPDSEVQGPDFPDGLGVDAQQVRDRHRVGEKLGEELKDAGCGEVELQSN